MADRTQAERILRYLQECRENSESPTTTDIAEATGLPQYTLHMVLRKLKKSGAVRENKGSTPPSWTLDKGGRGQQQPGSQDLEKRIIDYLQTHPSSHKAIDIARHLHLHGKKDVNRVLYKLERSKKVERDTSENVPKWSLPGRRPGMEHLFKPTNKDVSAPGAYNVATFPDTTSTAGGGSGYMVGAGDNAYSEGAWFEGNCPRGRGNWTRSRGYGGRGRRSRGRSGRVRGRGRGGRGRGRGYRHEENESTHFFHNGPLYRGGHGTSLIRGNFRGSYGSIYGSRGRNSQQGNFAYSQDRGSQNSPHQLQALSSEMGNPQTEMKYSQMQAEMNVHSLQNAETEHSFQSSSAYMDTRASGDKNNGDRMQNESSSLDDDDDDFNYYGEEDDVRTRMRDFMGGGVDGLGIGEDDDMGEEFDDYSHDDVLFEMNAKPDAFHNCANIALRLGLEEEDVKGMLEECREKGQVVQNQDNPSEWQLTDEGVTYIERLAASEDFQPFESMECDEDEEMAESSTSASVPGCSSTFTSQNEAPGFSMAENVSGSEPSFSSPFSTPASSFRPPPPPSSAPNKGPPPSPRQLLKSNPVFSAEYPDPSIASTTQHAEVRLESFRQIPLSGGHVVTTLADDMGKVTVKGVADVRDVENSERPTVKGVYDVQDVEAAQGSSASQTSLTSPSAVKTGSNQPQATVTTESGRIDPLSPTLPSTQLSGGQSGAPWADEKKSDASEDMLAGFEQKHKAVPLSAFVNSSKSESQQSSAGTSMTSLGSPSSSQMPAQQGTSPQFGGTTAATAEFHSLPTTAPLQRAAFASMPQVPTTGGAGLTLSPSLQNAVPVPGPYEREGLVMVPAPTTKMAAATQPFHPPPTPMQLLGKPEPVSHASSLEITSLPRSHSQPVFGSGPSSLPAGLGTGSTSNLQITSESFAALNKNPISALMEYAQSRRMQAQIEVIKQSGPSHRPVFVMAARVGTRVFPGVTCHNKKDGRKEAADVALRTLIAEGQYSAAAPTPSVTVPKENMTHFDKVAALTHQTFNSLIASIPENLAGRKVIAGLVMKRNEDDVGIVISIGTGNRCITGDKLSLEGYTVNDSHAEIITRRGFMRFLYQQLLTYEEGKSHDLFEKGPSGKLRVKPEITFHLYISTAPCGDGALFSPRDVESNSGLLPDVNKRKHHPTFTNNVQGLLRTKMEGGEGTIPIDASDITVQTWDGVVRGERLRTMSCTDKICRWNVLGLQGALLSHFVEPVYLDSLTLGFLYDHGHLSRAVCCRLDRGNPPLDCSLPQGFHLNHPWLGRVTACQPLRETQKTKAFSINWTVGDSKPEVLDGTLGHCYTAVEKKLFSRVAKRCMYDSFKQVASHLKRSDLQQVATSYRNAKMAAKEFQNAKVALMKKFQATGCGAWVKKPVEEEMFS